MTGDRHFKKGCVLGECLILLVSQREDMLSWMGDCGPAGNETFLEARSVPNKQMGRLKRWGRHTAYKSLVDISRWDQVPTGAEQGARLVCPLQKPLAHMIFWLLLNDTLTQGWRNGAKVKITCCSSEDPASVLSTHAGL